jgi:hypothetical protein
MYDFRFNNLCRLDGHLKHRDILVGIAGSKVTRSKFAKIITIHGERMIDQDYNNKKLPELKLNA